MEDTQITHVKDVYEKIANHFSNTRKVRWDWVDSFILNIKPGSVVYDIGCGNGRNMISNHVNFIGVDNCENFLKICREKNLNVINSNIKNLPFRDNSADAILCIAVFHHLSNFNDRILALNEIKRVAKNDSLILLSVWSINQPKKTKKNFTQFGDNIVLWNCYGKIYKRYYYLFKLSEINNLFEIVGLKVLDYQYNCGNEIFILKKC